MKKITLIALMLFTALGYAQVGINTNNPDASSALEIESTTGGILIPRLTETQRDDISAPATGLMIYQTNGTSGFYFYDGAAWTKIDGVAGPQGPAGPAGPSGAAGADGVDGADGSQGPVGPAGADGAQGLQGPAGPAGPSGAAGADGVDGADGSQGPVGPAGADGAQGLQGPAGPAGADGASYTQPTYLNNTFYAELGGYVIQISPNGKHGLVVAMQDQGFSNWYEASGILSNPSNHDADGKEFSDWRLPNKRELNLMYGVYISGNGAYLSAYYYWSSTENENDVAWKQNVGTGVQLVSGKSSTNPVRAVRAF
jgi:hypothetical protein